MSIGELKQECCSILWVQRPRKRDCQTSDLCELQQNLHAWMVGVLWTWKQNMDGLTMDDVYDGEIPE